MDVLDAAQSEMRELHGQHNPITPPASPVLTHETTTEPATMLLQSLSQGDINRETFSEQLAHLTLQQIDASNSDQMHPIEEHLPEQGDASSFGLANLSVCVVH